MSEFLPSPRLPWELLDTFIDELGLTNTDPSSLGTLCNCALTCHRLHFRAGKHIFRDIVIRLSFKPQLEQHIGIRITKRLEDLYHILTTNESIAPRVHSFTIETVLGSMISADSETLQMILANVHLPEVLSKLGELHHFGWINHGAPFSWLLLRDIIQSGLDSLFLLPSLHSLAFECINDLPPLSILRCDQLKHLHLVHVYVPPAASSQSIQNRPQAPIKAGMRLKIIVNYNSFDTSSTSRNAGAPQHS